MLPGKRPWIKTAVLLAIVGGYGCTALTALLNDGDGPGDKCVVKGVDETADARVLALGFAFRPEQLTLPTRLETELAAIKKAVLDDCIIEDRTNVVLLPDGMGELFALTGSRTAKARAAATVTEARGLLAEEYRAQIAGYRQRFPDLDDPRALTLSLTNNIRMMADRVAAVLADENVLLAIPVVSAAAAVTSDNPTDRAIFGDAEYASVTAYVAQVSTVTELLLLYDHNGLISTTPQGYGQRTSATSLLASPPHNLDDILSVPLEITTETGPRTIQTGFMSARDMHSPILHQRLHDLGAQVLFAQTAVDRWAVTGPAGIWRPARHLAALWLPVQQFAGFSGGAAAFLSGNLLGFSYDGQSHGALKAKPGLDAEALLGTGEVLGLTTVTPWALLSALSGQAGFDGPTTAMHPQISDLAQTLYPGSGAPSENSYTTTLAVLDLHVPPNLQYDFGDSVSGAHQQDPAVATIADGAPVFAWTHRSTETTTIHWGRLEGEGISDRGEITPIATAGTGVRLAALTDRIAAVWSQGAPGLERIRLSRYDPETRTWQQPAQSVTSSAGAQWWPDIAATSDALSVVWLDLSSNSMRLRFAGGPENNVAMFRTIDESPGKPDLHRSAIGKPSISQHADNIWITWPKTLGYGLHQAHWSRSTDGGATFSSPATVAPADPTGTSILSMDNTFDAAGDMIAVYSRLQTSQTEATIILARSTDGSQFDRREISTGYGGLNINPHVTVNNETMVVVWRNLDGARDRIVQWRQETGLEPTIRTIVETDSDQRTHLWNPAATLTESGAVVIWEDGGSGYSTLDFAVDN